MKLQSREQVRLRERYGPWAVITGASSGIGRALAEAIAAAGIHCVLVARRGDETRALGTHLAHVYGVEWRAVEADLSTAAGIQRVSDETRDIEVGLLVASAGFGTSGRFVDSPIEEELNMLRVNCEALLALTHHYARDMARRRRGGLILMSSMVAFQGVPHAAHYAATKAYVQSLAEALHVELAPVGVDVLAAAPGPTNSGFAQRAHMRLGAAMDPVDLARPLLYALGRRMTTLPGFLTKFLVGSLATLPRRAKVRVMGVVMNGMTAHQTRSSNTD